MYVGSYNNSYYNSVYGSGVKSTFGAPQKSAAQTAASNFLGSNGVNSSLYNSSAMKYVTGLKDEASSLKDAIGALTSLSAYSKKTAVSSDTKALGLSQSTSSVSANAPKTVRIDQLASGQVNEGTEVKSSAKVGAAAAGQKQFEITADGKSYRFNIEVGANDSNRAVQQKMADAINARNIGITASVSRDSKTGGSQLNIAADGTGDSSANRFEIRDTKGDLVSRYGADTVAQEAQNALYSVDDGPQRSSSSNQVYIGGGITATFKEATGEDIKINQGTNPDEALKQIEKLQDAYNGIYSAAVANSDDPKAAKLFDDLLNAAGQNASKLAELGIGFDTDGRMTIDEDKVKAAAADGSLEKAFTGGGVSGFTNGLSRIASNIQYSPSTYSSSDTFSNSNLSNLMYSGIGTNSQQLQLNIMNRLFKIAPGLMVNMYG